MSLQHPYHIAKILAPRIARPENIQFLLHKQPRLVGDLLFCVPDVDMTRPVNATSSTAARKVSGSPIASITTSGPRPPVSSASRAWRSSSAELIE
jgi:hypothetical protein